jgi:hypothetical protein
MKILIFLDHDIIVRNFVSSGAFRTITRNHDVKFILPEKGNKRLNLNPDDMDLGAPYERLPINTPRHVAWSDWFQVNDLRWRPGVYFKGLRAVRRMVLGMKASILLSILALPGIFQCFRIHVKYQLKKHQNVALDQLLDRENPDIILHPNALQGFFLNDLVEEGNKRKIPTVFLMNSWDNPCIKRAIIGNPDWLLVWGSQTKEHAIRFMGMPEACIPVLGVPQFEVYNEKPRTNREEFCLRHNIDREKTIVLYAGSSKGTDEYEHLCMLDEAIEDGRLPNSEIVYRPHPWGGGGKGGERIIGHNWRHVIIEETMRAYLTSIQDIGFAITSPDYKNTQDVLVSVDCLISPLSTILLEGALHGLPAACFLPEQSEGNMFHGFAAQAHFHDIYESENFVTIRGVSGLIDGVRKMIKQASDPEFAGRMKAECQYFVKPFEQPYCDRLDKWLVEKFLPSF